jgi:hypothetical protein
MPPLSAVTLMAFWISAVVMSRVPAIAEYLARSNPGAMGAF